MIDWLKNRLSPPLYKANRWKALAESLQQLIADEFDPEFDRLKAMRSIYTAAEADLDAIASEIEIPFHVALSNAQNKPIAIAHRRLELRQKGTVDALVSALRRSFFGAKVKWVPLYAPKAQSYGTSFISLSDISGDLGDYYLTSRGRIVLDAHAVLASGFPPALVDEEIGRQVAIAKPAHIVYDGTINEVSETCPYVGGAIMTGTRMIITQTA